MQFTRRTFLGSSMAAGVMAAAEVVHAPWLLSTKDPLRIGLLGGREDATAEHLALFAAVPGAQVTGMVKHADVERTRSALHKMREFSQPEPVIYDSAESMLQDCSFQAFSLPGSLDYGVWKSLRGRPVLAELPHYGSSEKEMDVRFPRAVFDRNALVRYRLEEFLYPSSTAMLKTWLSTQRPQQVRATLVIPLLRSPAVAHHALTVALSGLLTALCGPRELLCWADTVSAQGRVRHTGGSIPLPQNPYGMAELTVQPFAVDPVISTLKMESRSGALTMAIAAFADAQTSLETVMRFLSDVRSPATTHDRSPAASIVAAGFVGGALNPAQS